MEKVIYALWRAPDTPPERLTRHLLEKTGPAVARIGGVHSVRLNLTDSDVDSAAGLKRCTTQPPIDAVVQIWLDVSHGEFRAPVDALIQGAAGRAAAWLVTESEVIPNRLHPPRRGARTPGWSQVCFLQKPERLSYEEWLAAWQGLHTRVAMDTQANFEYVQNVVVRQLLGAPLPFCAMVEECFPQAAMTDPQVFFDASGDPEKFRRNTEAMMASCARFIDFERIDVLPTSQYVLDAST
jgi:hypothetical protein